MAKAGRAKWEIGPPRGREEALLFVHVFTQALLADRPPTPEWTAGWLARIGPRNLRLAREGRRVVGGLALLPMGQWFGGRSVPMTGVGAVAVRPEDRASGAGSALMAAAVREMHEAGTAISVLFPATQPVYRRAGYEIAGVTMRYRLPTRSLALKSRPLAVRPFGPADPARARKIYDAWAPRGAGLLNRTDWLWSRALSAPDGTTVNAHVAERAGEIEGYLAYAHDPVVDARFDVRVKDLVATTRDAALSLLSFLGDHRSMVPAVHYHGAPNDPLLLLLEEPDWTVGRRLDWMLRVTDVRAALETRGYAPGLEAELHLAIADATLPSNAGRYRVAVSGGRATVERGGKGRVKLDVRGLASLFTGWMSAAQVEVAGLASGTPADLAELSGVFAGPVPWMPDQF